jgi:hypothetical protein
MVLIPLRFCFPHQGICEIRASFDQAVHNLHNLLFFNVLSKRYRRGGTAETLAVTACCAGCEVYQRQNFRVLAGGFCRRFWLRGCFCGHLGYI